MFANKKNVYFCTLIWSCGRGVRHRSAKPSTAVRIRSRPLLNLLLVNAVGFFYLTMSRIVLIGFPGSGKSIVGRKLASKLQCSFFDLDQEIERKYKISIEHFFQKYEEENFRLCERQVLLELLQQSNCIISTGGGTPCFFDNLSLILSSSFTIYIQLSPQSLFHRLTQAHKVRPLLKGKSEEELLNYIESELAKREKFYEQAHLVFKGEDVNLDLLVSEIKDAGFLM